MPELRSLIRDAVGRDGVSPAAPAPDSRATSLYSGERHSLSIREALALLARSWPFIAAHRRQVALKFAIALTSLTFFLALPWPLKIIIDNVINGRPLSGLPRTLLFPICGDSRLAILAAVSLFLLFATIAVGVAGENPESLSTDVGSGGLDQAGATTNDANSGWSLWSGAFGLWEIAVTIDLTQRLNQSVRTALYERFLRSPLRLYADQKIGDAVFRVMNDSASIGGVLYRGIMAPILALAMFSVALTIMTLQFRHEPLIPLLAIVLFPVIALGSALFARLLRDQSQRMRERGSNIMAAFEERLAQIQLIKAFGQEQRETAAVDRASWESFRATLVMLALGGLAIIVIVPLGGLVVGTGLYHLMKEVIAGRLTLGDLTLLAGYITMLVRPMVELGTTWIQLQDPLAGMRRVHSVLDGLPAAEADAGGRALDGPISQIELRGVELGYDDAPILRGVSLELRRGEIAALAGLSGAGKSTLIASIPRFIEPLRGTISIDGIDARELAPAAIRRRFGFVFQREALFSMPIDGNIAYGSDDADAESIRAAAARAGAAEFIESLPNGYAEMLGRRGARLSVGQKQRIAIARALLRDPDVLVLDEPTAPLDPQSEAALMATLRALARDKIVLIVAHRPETLAACDRVYFVCDGGIAACGPHAQLVKTSALYRSYLGSSILS